MQDNHEEYQYLNLMKKVIETGSVKPSRNGDSTLSVFGECMKFSLSVVDTEMNIYMATLPLLTTKKINYKFIVEELLWFLRGSTNAKELHDVGVKIWDENSNAEQQKKLGLNREEYDCGPIYGFNWRHFGAEYINCTTDYTGQGVDQIQKALDTLKDNPYSRRNIVSAWNPAVVDKSVLPPCHTMFQFSVERGSGDDDSEYLDCMVTQRSADIPLGMPYNIASYATLTHIFAELTDKIPRTLIYCVGDAHIYQNQVEKCKIQLERTPYEFPGLELESQESIEDYRFEHFKLRNYQHHPHISYPFSV